MERDAKKHPCHKTGNGFHNNNRNHSAGVDQNGHIPSEGCTNPSHYTNGDIINGVCICCCHSPASVTPPQQTQS